VDSNSNHSWTGMSRPSSSAGIVGARHNVCETLYDHICLGVQLHRKKLSSSFL